MQDLCDHFESGLQFPPNGRVGKNGKACGMALFLFQEGGKMLLAISAGGLPDSEVSAYRRLLGLTMMFDN